jgi:hypothetical protein
VKVFAHPVSYCHYDQAREGVRSARDLLEKRFAFAREFPEHLLKGSVGFGVSYRIFAGQLDNV